MPGATSALETNESKTKRLGNNNSIKPMFDSIIYISKLLGVYNDFLCRIFRTENTFGWPTIRSKFHLVYCLFVNLIILLNSPRVFSEVYYHWNDGLSTSLVSTVTCSVMYTTYTYVFVTTLWTLSRELKPLVTKLLHYEDIYGWVFNPRRLNKIFKYGFPTVLCLSLCGSVSFLLIIDTSQKDVPVIKSILTFKMFGIDDMEHITFKIIWAFGISVITSTGTNVWITMICLTAYILYSEIWVIGETVRKIDAERMNRRYNIRQIKARQEVLLNLVSAFDSCIRHFIAAQYVGTLTIICLTIYTNVQGTLHGEERTTELGFLSVMLISISITTVAAVLLSKKIHGPLNVLHRLDLSEMSEKDMHEVSIFMSRLSGQSMGITIYGLFVLDQSSILATLGTILTYAIVMLQFRPSEQVGQENGKLLNLILATVNKTEMKMQSIVNGSLT